MRFSLLVTSVSLAFSSAAFACEDDESGHHGKAKGAHKKDHHTSQKHDDEHAVSIQSDAESLSGEVSMKVAGMMCSSAATSWRRQSKNFQKSRQSRQTQKQKS